MAALSQPRYKYKTNNLKVVRVERMKQKQMSGGIKLYKNAYTHAGAAPPTRQFLSTAVVEKVAFDVSVQFHFIIALLWHPLSLLGVWHELKLA